jgi:hypothetical protein
MGLADIDIDRAIPDGWQHRRQKYEKQEDGGSNPHPEQPLAERLSFTHRRNL